MVNGSIEELKIWVRSGNDKSEKIEKSIRGTPYGSKNDNFTVPFTGQNMLHSGRNHNKLGVIRRDRAEIV